MQAPIVYQLWWAVTESCFGQPREFAATRWYVVPGADKIVVGGRDHHGYWWPDGKIILAERAVLDGRLVRHEMLHAISGSGRHPEYFAGRCGGIVACSDECIREAGEPPAPAAAAPEVAPSDLDVSVRIDPATSASPDSGWVAVTVSAENPNPQAVWVKLASLAPGESASSTFGIVLTRCAPACANEAGSEYAFTWSDRMGFGGHATRRLMFDRQLTPGRYELRAHFNSDTTLATSLLIPPW